ncbi:MAG: hypothetical protein F4Z10_07775 [Synechococcus sp. SB0666_bin_14]|nr:hypothetical protein [Synechococcus sp. SB0666_bin_14]MYA91492.1 hypothetical protein [Synechococcus sp. SB0663_bin_10]MYG46917.1 hypothetical protein [Synechococcus sp. SB0675_bin_6]MYJ58958.1 hypothetical protein [Synechococcus sp. SB0672_bin_6]MYK90552.1 hypothetical protein [Synechococcus sp. SB0669_bin_8]
MMKLEEIKSKLDGLSPVKVSFVARVIEALSNPPALNVRSVGTWLTANPEWTEYFGLALSVHHGATTEPLRLTAFETVFRNACEHMDWNVLPPESQTQRFIDMTVSPRPGMTLHLSLKSTAARNLSKTSLHISKLTEASWIQDIRKASQRRFETINLFRAYRQAVSHIIMLRAFRDKQEAPPYLYQLVEVPVSIFDSIEDAPVEAFASDGPRVPCMVDGKQVATVALDRSDAKITVSGISLSACIIHAEWQKQEESQRPGK